MPKCSTPLMDDFVDESAMTQYGDAELFADAYSLHGDSQPEQSLNSQFPTNRRLPFRDITNSQVPTQPLEQKQASIVCDQPCVKPFQHWALPAQTGPRNVFKSTSDTQIFKRDKTFREHRSDLVPNQAKVRKLAHAPNSTSGIFIGFFRRFLLKALLIF